MSTNLFFSSSWLPSLSPKEIVVYCVMYPFITASSFALSFYAIIAGNLLAISLHLIDWLKALSMAKKLSERTNKGKEKLDGYFQQVLHAFRAALILILLFSLHFTFLAFCGTIHAIYSALFQKDGSVTGRGIRWIGNGISHMLVGSEIFKGPRDGDHAHHNDNVVVNENEEVEAAEFMPAAQSLSSPPATDEGKTRNATPPPATASEPAETNAASNKTTSAAPSGPAPAKKAQNPAQSARARGLNPTYGSGAKRKSSVKMAPAQGNTNGNGTLRCEVVNEGSHFNRTARGCLLPMVE